VETEDEEVVDLKITTEVDCILDRVQAHTKETDKDHKYKP